MHILPRSEVMVYGHGVPLLMAGELRHMFCEEKCISMLEDLTVAIEAGQVPAS